MPGRLKVNIDYKQAIRAIEELPGLFPARIQQKMLVSMGKVIAQKAKTPNFAFNDRTGRLRSSIRVKSIRGRKQPTRLYAGVTIGGTGARQGLLIEVGTQRMKARSPLFKAAENSLSEQRAAIESTAVKEFIKLGQQLRSGRIPQGVIRDSVIE